MSVRFGNDTPFPEILAPDTDTILNPASINHDTSTPVAVSGPLFPYTIVYTTVVPDTPAVVETLPVTYGSVSKLLTIPDHVVVLSDESLSGWLPITSAVFVIELPTLALAATRHVITTLVDAPLASEIPHRT